MLPFLLVAVVCMLLFVELRGYALLGFDTYPLIASSRVESAPDLVGIFSERLMDGRYPSAFYRPVVSASFALDHALYGLAPAGYHATDVVLFALLALSLAALARSVVGRGAVVAPVVAALVLVLHPSAVEILPIASRRADLWCALFSALTLRAQFRAPSRAREFTVAGFSLLALASKETALALPALALAAGWLRALHYETVSHRSRAAFVSALPVFAAWLAMLALRWFVLGGLGGHGSQGPAQFAATFPSLLLGVIRGVAIPRDVGLPSLLPGAIVAGLWLFAAVRITRAPDLPTQRCGRLVALGLAWSSISALAYSAGGWMGAWYWLAPACGLALGVSGLTQWAVGALRAASAPRMRAVAGLCLAAVLATTGWNASRSAIFHSYGEWRRASVASDAFLSELLRRIDAAPGGTLVTAPPLPMWVEPRAEGPTVEGGAILSDYSLQAWADLLRPARNVRVLPVEGGVLQEASRVPAPDEVVISIPSRMIGF